MHKTEGITKYNLEWQLVRSSIKGSKVKLEDKLTAALKYYESTKSYDRWERVYNWLEGLWRGYKAANNLEAMARIADMMDTFDAWKDAAVNRGALPTNRIIDAQLLRTAGDNELIGLWNDLFRTNEGWLKKGYYHVECNEFMDFMYDRRLQHLTIKDRYSYEKLNELRHERSQIKNKHKFFF